MWVLFQGLLVSPVMGAWSMIASIGTMSKEIWKAGKQAQFLYTVNKENIVTFIPSGAEI